MSGADVLMMVLLALAPATHARGLAVAEAHGGQAHPRAIALELHGPADDARALRATLQELTARRGLALSFELAGDDHAQATAPWATLSVELGETSTSGPAVVLREGAAGPVRLHRVVPGGASHQVTIETLATIAYTALEALSLEESARAPGRPAPAPRQRAGTAAAHERAAQSPAEPEAAPATPGVEDAAAPAPPAEPPATSPPVEQPPSTNLDPVALTLSSHAAAPESVADAALPVRLSLASFAGYQTGDGRAGEAWGMGLAAEAAIPRWLFQPALGLGLGNWYGAGRESGTATDGSPRATAGARLQGQAEVRLTLLRVGRFSAALGPWLTASRATYEFGAAPMGTRGPGPNQGPSNQGPDPSAAGVPTRVTHTEISAGGIARFEAALGGRFALYCALAGATPLTTRPQPSAGRLDSGSPNGTEDAAIAPGTRWTLSALAGLSVDLTGARPAF